MTHVVVSPCRNESDFMMKTLNSVAAQSLKPDLWIIVDDGSTDDTPELLEKFANENAWVKIVAKPDRGHRAVGPGVIEAFYYGLDTINLDDFDYVTKLDLDLDLPTQYFEILIGRMEENPRIGTCSGKPYFRANNGELRSEMRGDEMSVGMTKVYRAKCFKDIGGFVREVMWDGIDCHACRKKGWIACSWDEPDLVFEHLRPMGSSQKGIITGKIRHGFGQYFMGSDPLYFVSTAIFRMREKPYVIGGLAIIWGYFSSMIQRKPQLADKELRDFISRYQKRVLSLRSKTKATAEFDAEGEGAWLR